MKSIFSKHKLIKFFQIGSLILIPISLIFCLWILKLNENINERIEKKWFLPPLEFYSAPERLHIGMKLNNKKIHKLMTENGYRLRTYKQNLNKNDYSLWNIKKCRKHFNKKFENAQHCLLFLNDKNQRNSHLQLALLNEDNKIISVHTGRKLKPTDSFSLKSILFAQYYNKKPILRRIIKISETPLTCLNAITSIEDQTFLSHKGISLSGIIRAFFSLLVNGRITQGGSTITQQLVKNYFLTSERSFQRKFKEFFMAILLELKVDKNKILENYLNVIYMGQNGPFQVRGYGAASEFYFNKKLEDLELPDCALLAAIVNSPGRFSPFKKNPFPAKKRRTRVLEKMKNNNHIDEDSYKKAIKAPLPKRRFQILSEPAPYFVQAILHKLKEQSIDSSKGLKIYSTMIPSAQEAAHQAVKEGLANLNNRFPLIKKLKKQNKNLEAVLLAADLKTNKIIALIGGHNFKKTQFNRATHSHRQVGSIMKPLVYLTALENLDTEGNQFNPLSLIQDSEFKYTYEKQSWSPQNYSKKYYGKIPLFIALKNSINVSTAKLGLQTGLNSIIDVSKRMGIKSDLKAYPSLSLGAFELYPLEVLQAYSSIARFGQFKTLSLLSQVQSLKGKSLYRTSSQSKQVIAPQTAAVLIGMMKQTILNGTGRSIPLRGFTHPSAGKTGTTSDTKDSWFAGFTPYILCVVWVGFDDNTPHGLTGSNGALPIWTKFMKSYAAKYPKDDFDWPEGTSRISLDNQNLKEQLNDPDLLHTNEDIELIFRNQNAPYYANPVK